jgi:uncharacterized NAD-dependent epimerase/dehydratase family protein
MISEKPVIAVTVNHDDICPAQVPAICAALEQEVGVPVLDVLMNGGSQLVQALGALLKSSPLLSEGRDANYTFRGSAN